MFALALKELCDPALESRAGINAVISLLLLMCIHRRRSRSLPPCQTHNYTVQTQRRTLETSVCPCSSFAQWSPRGAHLPSPVKGASLAVLCPSDRVPARLRHPGNMKRSRAEMSAGRPICQSVGW